VHDGNEEPPTNGDRQVVFAYGPPTVIDAYRWSSRREWRSGEHASDKGRRWTGQGGIWCKARARAWIVTVCVMAFSRRRKQYKQLEHDRKSMALAMTPCPHPSVPICPLTARLAHRLSLPILIAVSQVTFPPHRMLNPNP
jgi:hypothetical protein